MADFKALVLDAGIHRQVADTARLLAGAGLLIGGAVNANAALGIKADCTIAVPAALDTWRAIDFQASTLSLAAGGVAPTELSLATFAAPTISGPYTIPTAATVTIAGPPIAAGGATITKSIALAVLAGDVGIGTNAPDASLHVYRSVTAVFKVQSTLADATAVIEAGGATSVAGFALKTVTRQWEIQNDGLNDVIRFYVGNGGVGDTFTLTPTGNVIIGGPLAAGATAAKCLALSNSATAPTGSADLCHLYSADNGAGHATLAIYAEEVVAAVGVKTVTEVLPVFINGTLKYIALAA